MKLSRTSRARTLLSTSIWLHAIAIAPQNATRKQARNPNDGELGPVSCAEHDRDEVAPTVGPQNQERDGKQEGELRERHKIEGAKRPRRERGKRRLKRHEERGRDRIGSS